MFARIYTVVGSLFLGGYAVSSLLGYEWTNPDQARPAPPPGALVATASRGWSGRSSSYSTSGGRGWVIFGGK
jgi:hypothetical protein